MVYQRLCANSNQCYSFRQNFADSDLKSVEQGTKKSIIVSLYAYTIRMYEW